MPRVLEQQEMPFKGLWRPLLVIRAEPNNRTVFRGPSKLDHFSYLKDAVLKGPCRAQSVSWLIQRTLWSKNNVSMWRTTILNSMVFFSFLLAVSLNESLTPSPALKKQTWQTRKEVKIKWLKFFKWYFPQETLVLTLASFPQWLGQWKGPKW